MVPQPGEPDDEDRALLEKVEAGFETVVQYQEETRAHRALTYDHAGAIGTWAPSDLPTGQALRQPGLLFKKLDESVIEEEYARLEG